MNRLEKIKRLGAVGFDIIQLSRLPNHELELTYVAGKRLMEVKRQQIQQVMQEGSFRKAQIEREVEWSKKWVNPKAIPICTVKSDVSEITGLITQYEQERVDAVERFRATGHKKFAQAANRAEQARKIFEQQLQLVTEARV